MYIIYPNNPNKYDSATIVEYFLNNLMLKKLVKNT